MSLLAAQILDATGQPAVSVRFDEPFRVGVSYRINDSIENATVGASFMDLAGNLIFESWDTDAQPNGHSVRSPGMYRSTCFVPETLLKPGRYWLSIAAHVPNRKVFDREITSWPSMCSQWKEASTVIASVSFRRCSIGRS